MSDFKRRRRFDPTWGELTWPGPLWKHDEITSYDWDNRPNTGGLSPLSFTFNVRSPTGVDRHPVFGGYCDGRLLRVMYRFYEGKPPGSLRCPADTVATLGPEDTYIVHGNIPGAYLRVEDWWRFGQLRAGSYFKINDRLWAKLAAKDLRRLLKDRIFDIAFAVVKPPAGMKPRAGEEIYVAGNHPPRPGKPAFRFVRFRSAPPGRAT